MYICYTLHETSLIQMLCPATAIRAILAQAFVLPELQNAHPPPFALWRRLKGKGLSVYSGGMVPSEPCHLRDLVA